MRNLLLAVGMFGAALVACSDGPQGFYGTAYGPGATPTGSSSGGGSGGSAHDAGTGSGSSSGGSTGSSSGSGTGSSSGAGSSSGSATGSSSGGASSDAGSVPAVCTSGVYYTSGGGDGNGQMSPGEACNGCHSSHSSETSAFSIGGTVYKTAHEPVDCSGVSTPGVTVVITDANGATVTLPVNNAGNFYSTQSIATPYKAAVQYGGLTMNMHTAQTSGDCNSCHNQAGASGAPGRVMLP